MALARSPLDSISVMACWSFCSRAGSAANATDVSTKTAKTLVMVFLLAGQYAGSGAFDVSQRSKALSSIVTPACILPRRSKECSEGWTDLPPASVLGAEYGCPRCEWWGRFRIPRLPREGGRA